MRKHVTIESCNQPSEELYTTVTTLEGAYTEIVLDIPFCVSLELFVSGDREFEIQIMSYCMGIGEQTQIQLPIVGVRVHLTAHFAPHVLDLTPMQSHFCCLDS